MAQKSQIGRAFLETHNDLKGKLTSTHPIFYRVLEDQTIEITRILHE
jgi:plasmid stabilization system protein ParE